MTHNRNENDASAEANELAEMIYVIGRGYDGTRESQKGILKLIAYWANEPHRDEEDWAVIINEACALAEKGVLNGREVVEQLIVPLAYGTEDPELLLNIASCITHSAVAFNDKGHVLGASPLDVKTFETLAMLFTKLPRTQVPREGSPSAAWIVRSFADCLDCSLRRKDENDPDIIALIEPFTSRHAEAARHKRASKAAAACQAN